MNDLEEVICELLKDDLRQTSLVSRQVKYLLFLSGQKLDQG